MNDRSARFLTHSPPSPGISGDRIRVFNLARALKASGWTVRVWSLFGPDEPAGSADGLRAIVDEVVLVPRDPSVRRREFQLALDTLVRRALYPHWFWSDRTARAATEWLADAGSEPLFVEQLYMYPCVPGRLLTRVVLDTQNHETSRMRGISRDEGNVGRRSIARLQVGPVERYEREAVQSVGRVVAVSDIEAAEFERLAPGRVRLVPNGVDVVGIAPISAPPASRTLLFLGSLSYSANVDAVRHFATDIAPHLLKSGATLTVVGSSPTASVYEAASRAPLPVTVVGYARDLRHHYLMSRAMIVPLRHGGGTRLKILEALAWGLPVVTTSIGAAGLGLTPGRHALVADSPQAFGAAVEMLLDDDGLWRRLSVAGREFVEERYDWRHIGAMFEAVMAEVADNPSAGPQ